MCGGYYFVHSIHQADQSYDDWCQVAFWIVERGGEVGKSLIWEMGP